MTMFIAGHETTAAVLTWAAVYLLAQNPEKIRKAQAEIDAVLGQGPPTYESMKKLEYIRLIVGDSSSLQCSSHKTRRMGKVSQTPAKMYTGGDNQVVVFVTFMSHRFAMAAMNELNGHLRLILTRQWMRTTKHCQLQLGPPFHDFVFSDVIPKK